MSEAPRIVKMSGAGNDFIVLGPEAATALGGPSPDWIRRACCRRLSIGSDGVLVVEPAGDARVRVTFYNPDASLAFCGNGTRCAARFALLEGLAASPMRLETAAGLVPAEIEDGRVALELPPPTDRGERTIELAGELLTGRFVDAGCPHFVVSVADVEHAPLERWGPALRRHPSFGPAGANVDLVGPPSDGKLRLRTWERGVEGETLACGSGAVAAAFADWLARGPSTLSLVPRSGVPIEIAAIGEAGRLRAVQMAGDARVVLDGRLGAEATAGFDPAS